MKLRSVGTFPRNADKRASGEFPVSTELTDTLSEVTGLQRLLFRQHADFVSRPPQHCELPAASASQSRGLQVADLDARSNYPPAIPDEATYVKGCCKGLPSIQHIFGETSALSQKAGLLNLQFDAVKPEAL